MNRLIMLCCATFLGLSACGDPSRDVQNDESLQSDIEETVLSTDGRIVISSLPKVFEPNACILPITVQNGTETEVSVSMMEFSVTGTGDDDSGNMFAQSVEAGETNTAYILFPTRQCDELLEITANNLTCKTMGEDCSESVEFESIEDLTIRRK
ncbi:hypothetical protein DES40_1854 [Litorimonas taeanensis]|uniref:Lipoprotein n=1 Tax=Litorimonas taeanensis TaxID=568099 RepID=A0A420WDK9_9PROT|nr:hypothetical protein [Litorimonas taeanensis]RKQ69073.1 hypothetical protein DES40_1854 [Litorimonas taeanensis]